MIFIGIYYAFDAIHVWLNGKLDVAVHQAVEVTPEDVCEFQMFGNSEQGLSITKVDICVFVGEADPHSPVKLRALFS